MTTQTTLNRINRGLHALPTYCDEIPVDQMIAIVTDHGGQVVQEDGTPWAGILCGAEGHCVLTVTGLNQRRVNGLYIGWYKMQSGKYEVTSYVS